MSYAFSRASFEEFEEKTARWEEECAEDDDPDDFE